MVAPLTLYVDAAFLSPYAMSAFVALAEKGLPMQLRPVDLGCGEQRMRPYLARSLTGRVPALTHEDFHLAESCAIAQYLEEAFPAPGHPALYPPGLRSRAQARQMQAWLRSDLQALRLDRPTEVVFEHPVNTPLSDAGQAAAAKLVRVAQALLAHGGPNLFGDWCIADTDLALMLQRLARNGDELPSELRSYADAQWQRPAVQLWVRHHAAAQG
ncbi:glutathione S-transferase [Bordetella ansorpii]|uniref:Glutathione S-transferase n=1 Tax=Bordetella ansorpii TaxID=288768 RepID=A0A146AYQ9_9BORD|nr:glutathione transferase [Bordetella ansorpii]CZZ95474.1 glutathione S-transferase [Bordetella ansorpii]